MRHTAFLLVLAATTKSVYRIGSVTKQFTASAVMQLVDQHKIRLDDSIATWLPALPATWHKVTVRQLLNHTSGIPSYTDIGERWTRRWGEEMTPDTLVAFTARDTMWFPPGTQWRYDKPGRHPQLPCHPTDSAPRARVREGRRPVDQHAVPRHVAAVCRGCALLNIGRPDPVESCPAHRSHRVGDILRIDDHTRRRRREERAALRQRLGAERPALGDRADQRRRGPCRRFAEAAGGPERQSTAVPRRSHLWHELRSVAAADLHRRGNEGDQGDPPPGRRPLRRDAE